jgi:hypothetical protein
VIAVALAGSSEANTTVGDAVVDPELVAVLDD